MKRQPPGIDPWPWIEALLIRCLRPRDRESIPGDLIEDYTEAIATGCSRLRARARYLVQAGSVIGVALAREATARRVLLVLCMSSMLAMTWFGFRSSHQAIPILAAALISQAVGTILVVTGRGPISGLILQPGAIVLVLAGSLALLETIAWTAFEWKVALTGIALNLQGILTVVLQLGCFGGLRPRNRAS